MRMPCSLEWGGPRRFLGGASEERLAPIGQGEVTNATGILATGGAAKNASPAVRGRRARIRLRVPRALQARAMALTIGLPFNRMRIAIDFRNVLETLPE